MFLQNIEGLPSNNSVLQYPKLACLPHLRGIKGLENPSLSLFPFPFELTGCVQDRRVPIVTGWGGSDP